MQDVLHVVQSFDAGLIIVEHPQPCAAVWSDGRYSQQQCIGLYQQVFAALETHLPKATPPSRPQRVALQRMMLQWGYIPMEINQGIMRGLSGLGTCFVGVIKDSAREKTEVCF